MGSEIHLRNWPISCELDVQWGDLDSMNHVNHTVFLRWMEHARMHYFNSCGMMEYLESEKKGPILARIEANYLSPVNFPDKVTVYSTVSRIGNSSFDMEYEIISQSEMQKVANGKVTGVFVNYISGKSITIPNEIIDKIVKLESKD